MPATILSLAMMAVIFSIVPACIDFIAKTYLTKERFVVNIRYVISSVVGVIIYVILMLAANTFGWF